MPLVNAKCTNCGAPLEVDHAKDAAICPYCGSAFIVEKAINSYNISNNITGSVVNIYGGAVNDFDIRGGVLVKYNGASLDVVIPDTVKKIGESCFEGSMINSVVIPGSVEIIDWMAFQKCSRLSSLTLSKGLKEIGGYAFCGCTRLKNVMIPNGVKKIGNNAFGEEQFVYPGCTSLTSIVIPNSVREIEEDAFSGCTGLTSVTLSEGLTTIGSDVFRGCTKLASITIPDSVETIDGSAFNDCINLKEVNISARTLERVIYSLERTPFGVQVMAERARRQRQMQQEAWRSQGRCVQCGGERSVFGKCKSCGYKG